MPIPEEWNLSGKSAIITADRRGWTPFLAAALAEAGADVAIAGSAHSDAADAAKAVEEQGRRAININTDIMNADEVEAMTQQVVDEFGKVDILVNNACAEFGKPFEDVLESEWQTLLQFNVRSKFLCSQAVGRRMLAQESGRHREHRLRPCGARVVELGRRLRCCRRHPSDDVISCAGMVAARHTGQRHRRRLDYDRRADRGIAARTARALPAIPTQGASDRPVRLARLSGVRRLRLRHRTNDIYRRRRTGARLTGANIDGQDG